MGQTKKIESFSNYLSPTNNTNSPKAVTYEVLKNNKPDNNQTPPYVYYNEPSHQELIKKMEEHRDKSATAMRNQSSRGQPFYQRQSQQSTTRPSTLTR